MITQSTSVINYRVVFEDVWGDTLEILFPFRHKGSVTCITSSKWDAVEGFFKNKK